MAENPTDSSDQLDEDSGSGEDSRSGESGSSPDLPTPGREGSSPDLSTPDTGEGSPDPSNPDPEEGSPEDSIRDVGEPSDGEVDSSGGPEISREVPTPTGETSEVSKEVLTEDTSEISEPSEEELQQASASEEKKEEEDGAELNSPERRAFQASMAADLDAEGPEQLDPENLIGETLDERYRIEECIGAGGMAVVYRAYQEALDRDIVVKVLPQSFVDDEQAEARFEREARGMSQLEHPHVVSTYDFGRESGVAYICMEYVEGRTLSERIREGRIPYDEFCTIAVQILQGIGDAHAMGMVHRDIKPANIMLCERRGFESYVKLLDFGLAKLLQGPNQDVTKEQKLVGSVSFLSPEQIMGKEIDERVDVYSLGVLFYYMLSGEKPFTAEEDIRVLYQHVHSSPELLYNRLPDDTPIPEEQVDLIHRCLSKTPEHRPSDANALLEEFGAHVPSHAVDLPWTTGEFQAASGGGLDPGRSRERTSGRELPQPGRGRREAAEDSGSAERATPGSSATKVEGPPAGLREMENSEEGGNGRLLLAGLLVVGGLGIFIVLLTGSEGETPTDEPEQGASSNQVAAGGDDEPERESADEQRSGAAQQPSIRVEGVPGSRVFLDGEPIGSSPVETNVEPGEYQLEVRSEGEGSWKKSVSLTTGAERTFRPSLEAETDGEEAESSGEGAPAERAEETGGDSAEPSADGEPVGSGQASAGGSEAGRGAPAAGTRGARPSGTSSGASDESDGSTPEEGGANDETTASGGDSPDSEESEATAEVDEPEGKPESAAEATPPAPAPSDGTDESSESGSSDSESGLLPAEGSDESSTSSDDEGGGLLPVDE